MQIENIDVGKKILFLKKTLQKWNSILNRLSKGKKDVENKQNKR